jgi:hypothetical protein
MNKDINYHKLTISAYFHFLRDKKGYSEYYNELYNTYRHGVESKLIIDCYNSAMTKIKKRYGIS